ncbi:universal stress protein [Aestuariicoccus sp. MJ-SS9]|uniref:universal stress protein n=1 Tax=Aestuariicoccus sp. MJ-SS9 TaxID=3079855 RepID=UPI002909AB64|nr:universal stress protein [Aestuariicoccus sp. MJ-SS9]MDU8910120.1 universal stress protein [Aestuariicoccus sp. MJ-SS9]
MSEKFVVGYDGSAGSKRALDFALNHARAGGGSVVVAHVLEWSAYSFLTPEELEERHKRRKEELERAESHLIKPALAAIDASGIEVTSVIRYGHIAKVLCDIARETEATQMVVGRDGDGGIAARVFGSTAGSLVQGAPVPCTVVP